MKILITGSAGFVGKHLISELLMGGHEVITVDRGQAVEKSAAKHFSVDLTNSQETEVIPLNNVDAVIHLAGLSAVGPSFERPYDYISKNPAMLINLAESALKKQASPRFVVISSGAVYAPAQKMPLSETSSLDFRSPYAVSKVAVENFCEYYSSRGLDCVVVRPFNHIGPGQGEGFLLPDLAKRLSETTDGGEILTGNLLTSRDYTDVRDVVRAYALLATADGLAHSVYNVCSGRSHKGEEIFHLLAEAMHKENSTQRVDPSLVRPTDALDIIGDSSLIRADTGWKPEISIDITITDFLKAAGYKK